MHCATQKKRDLTEDNLNDDVNIVPILSRIQDCQNIFIRKDAYLEVGSDGAICRSLVLCRPLHDTLTWLYNNIPVNQLVLNFSSSLSVLLLDNSLVLCYSSCFVLCSHYGDSTSSKKLNGHRAFESMSLLGAFILLLKQHIS